MAHDAPVQHELIEVLIQRSQAEERALLHAVKRLRHHAEVSRQFRIDPADILQDVEDILKISMGGTI